MSATANGPDTPLLDAILSKFGPGVEVRTNLDPARDGGYWLVPREKRAEWDRIKWREQCGSREQRAEASKDIRELLSSFDNTPAQTLIDRANQSHFEIHCVPRQAYGATSIRASHKRVDVASLRNHSRLCDPVSVVQQLGLGEGAKRNGGGLLIRCPAHDDTKPSCSVRVGADGTLAWKCFGCTASGDVFHLIAAVKRLDTRRDFPRLLELAAGIAGENLEEHRSTERPARSAASKPKPPPRMPPAEEVSELWAACGAVYDDREVADALRSRTIDPGAVTDRDLARALPDDAPRPSWASSWRAPFRLIIPMFDGRGQLATLRARRPGKGDSGLKTLAAKGFSVAGAVMADALGRLLLAGQSVDWWRERTVIVAEGEPDFLTLATHYSDAHEQAPAVLGVVAGAWTKEIAARISNDVSVAIRTHLDETGNRYAQEIAASLGGRCKVFRRRAA